MSVLPQIVQRHFATKVRWLKGSLNNWISHPFFPFFFSPSVTFSLMISIVVSVSVSSFVGASITVDARREDDGDHCEEEEADFPQQDVDRNLNLNCFLVALVVMGAALVFGAVKANPIDSSMQTPENTVRANKMATHKLTLKKDTDGSIVFFAMIDSRLLTRK